MKATTTEYRRFLAAKSQVGEASGFKPLWLPPFLIDFQACLTEWAVRRGRASINADCGLGKTPMQLVWAENVVRHTNRPVLVVTTLGDSAQMIAEAEKFGVEAVRSRDGRVPAGARVVVTNYERLHHFDPRDFAGASLNEASILKNFAGKRRKAATEFLRTLPYRLLATATAAPNDYVELGTASEALGELGHMDMLSRFFKNEQGTNQGQRLFCKESRWRFRGHAEVPFWRWVCSWARVVRRPSDLGFADGRFALPPLVTREHVVGEPALYPGEMFPRPAADLYEQREEERRTVRGRCERAAALVAHHADPAVCWVHRNDEGDLLAGLIPGAVQVSGADRDEAKEEAFAAFAAGQVRVLVSKPTVAGFGLNWQHCAHQTYFPSHSFEQWYQALRRCWRFGQTRAVVADMVTTPGGAGVLANLNRKAAAADRMYDRVAALTSAALRVDRGRYGTLDTEVPTWL